MILKKTSFYCFCTVITIAGCGSIPETTIPGPLTARPVPIASPNGANGSIFQAANFRPLFEDRRPRIVGDILTISINEKTSAGKQSGSSASRTGSVGFAVPNLFGVPASTAAKLGLNASSSGKYDNKGAESSSNSFTGTIGATVIEVLSNGNLVVSGEKQIAFDQGSEFIRFYGVINPDTIASGNIVSSAQVADARVEYRTNTRIDKAAFSNMLARFFFSVMPI